MRPEDNAHEHYRKTVRPAGLTPPARAVEWCGAGARRLGHDRVRQWLKNRSIPAWHFNAVVNAAASVGVQVTYAELAALAEAKSKAA